MKPRLNVEQKITPLANKYVIYACDAEGKNGDVIAFAQQKRIAIKEKIQFYTDTSKQQLAFSMRAEKVMDVHGRYFVEDSDGNRIGTFKKDFKKSLMTSTWHIVDQNDTPQVSLEESNKTLAIIRRVGGFIPFVGDIIELIVMFMRFHFVFKDQTNTVIGRYQKTTLFRDHYTLSMTDEAYDAQDWRTYAAVSVALDALQGR